MPLEGKQLQNVARTVQQVVNEEQNVREIEEMIKKVSVASYLDETQKAKVLEIFGTVKEGLFDKLAKGIDKAAASASKKMGGTRKDADEKEKKEADTQADAQKKIDAGEKAPAGWRKNADGKAVKSKDPSGKDRY